MSDIIRRDPRAEWIARNRLHPLHAAMQPVQTSWMGPNGIIRKNVHGLGFIGPNGIKRIDRSGAQQGGAPRPQAPRRPPRPEVECYFALGALTPAFVTSFADRIALARSSSTGRTQIRCPNFPLKVTAIPMPARSSKSSAISLAATLTCRPPKTRAVAGSAKCLNIFFHRIIL